MRALLLCLLGFAVLVAGCGDDDPGDAVRGTLPTSTLPTSTVSTSTVAGATVPWPEPFEDSHQNWSIRVIDRVPHDSGAFTQGLELSTEGVIESTGRRGESTVRLTDPTTGAVTHSLALDPSFFGEGLTVAGDELVVLTWQSGVALRYDAATFEPRGEFGYDGEGWGICATENGLWMSDGSDVLTRRDEETFEALDTVAVRREDTPVTGLNELECIDDHIVANVWKSDEIQVIDPTTGSVSATIDAGALVADTAAADDQAVLNGIADLGDGTLLLGGKLWPTFFVVEIVAD